MTAIPLPAPTAETPLLAWLLDALAPMKRAKVKDLLRHGQVLVNGAPITQWDHRIKPGDRMALARERAVPSAHGLKQSGIVIVFEDESLIVIDKPSGLLTVCSSLHVAATTHLRLSRSHWFPLAQSASASQRSLHAFRPQT